MIRVSGRDMRRSRYVRKWGTSDFSSPRVPSISVRLLVPSRFDTPWPCPLRCGGTRLGHAGAPLIEGSAAWLECRHHALHPAGDHMLFIGEVLASAHRNVPPLLWHGGRYRVGDAHKPRRTD